MIVVISSVFWHRTDKKIKNESDEDCEDVKIQISLYWGNFISPLLLDIYRLFNRYMKYGDGTHDYDTIHTVLDNASVQTMMDILLENASSNREFCEKLKNPEKKYVKFAKILRTIQMTYAVLFSLVAIISIIELVNYSVNQLINQICTTFVVGIALVASVMVFILLYAWRKTFRYENEFRECRKKNQEAERGRNEDG